MQNMFNRFLLTSALAVMGTSSALAGSSPSVPAGFDHAANPNDAQAVAYSDSFLADGGDTVQRVLKDGATVHIFSNGKMAMEDKFGNAVRMDPGTVMETRGGQKLEMRGDDVARLDALLRQAYGSN